MMKREVLLKAICVGVAWIFGYVIVLYLGAGLGSVSNYALIAGWWFAAYVASQISAPMASTIPLGVSYLVLFLTVGGIGRNWFYQDVAELAGNGLAAVGMVQAIVIVSPIVFDWVFRRFIKIRLVRLCGDHSK
jgi:hypothetical protein